MLCNSALIGLLTSPAPAEPSLLVRFTSHCMSNFCGRCLATAEVCPFVRNRISGVGTLCQSFLLQAVPMGTGCAPGLHAVQGCGSGPASGAAQSLARPWRAGLSLYQS